MKVAIATGSSSGIGAASAVELSKRGWSLVINYSKSEAQAKKIAAQCKDAMTYSLARSLGPEVRVNAVCPGYVDTPWQHNALGTEKAKQAAGRYAAMVPLKDVARPEDVAEVVAWLIEGARQVTGDVVFVDGGLHVTPPR